MNAGWSRALVAARRLDEHELAAVQESRERTSLLDLRVRVPSRVVQRFDVDTRDLHEGVVPFIGRKLTNRKSARAAALTVPLAGARREIPAEAHGPTPSGS